MSGAKVAASIVWEIPREARTNPAPQRSSTWADFLRSQAEALLACGFFEAVITCRRELLDRTLIEPVPPSSCPTGV